MTYKKNFVAAIRVGGKVLRESSDRVELPFGSEYSILLKNLDSVRAQARISIDGKDATGWLIIQPGSDIEVERFVENLDKGNRFKFIEMTEQIEQHRGIKAEDGLVRVEFKREKVYEQPKVVEHHSYHHHYPSWPMYPYSGPIYYGGSNSNLANSNVSLAQSSLTRSANLATGMRSGAGAGAAVVVAAMNMSAPVNDSGITVPGSLSSQKFIAVSGFETERSEVIVLHLVGKKAGACVQVAKTVQVKLECETCGKKNKSNAKFCNECGTSLEKVGG